ncbi:MAG: MBL fold metallo-hydrolase [Proteobacteria bacterium]|nr:MBL fold metallo-hydrolase [Pseudomonadota bacterium]
MADLLALSEKIIEEGITDQPINPINFELCELHPDFAMVSSFSHCVLFKTDDGLVVFDTSNLQCGQPVLEAIRAWSRDPFHTIVYSHGHIDHVGASGAFMRDAKAAGHPVPRVIAHENLPKRLERYQATSGYNQTINRRQFGRLAGGMMTIADNPDFVPQDVAWPNVTYRDRMSLKIGSLDIDLHHGKGETDDHTWAWIGRYKAICSGDFFIWNFPNAGNPQKVQRYPAEWAQVMREMAGMGAEYLLPAHGLPVKGKERIKRLLLDVAEALENIVRQTLEMMNDGATLNEILNSVKVPEETLKKPYLQPHYDEPEFIVRNLWRLYGGWYDGNPANLKPADDRALAAEVADLAGGAGNLAERAEKLAADGDLRLACHLLEMAVMTDPDNVKIHRIRSDVYSRRRKAETSLMAKGIFRTTALESKEKVEGA